MKNRDKGPRGPRSDRSFGKKDGSRDRDGGGKRRDFDRDKPRGDFKRRDDGDGFKKRDRFPARSTTRRPREEGSEGGFKKRDDFKPRRDFDRDGGERKPFRSREDGDRPRREGGDFKRDDGDRKPFRKREDGDRKPFRSREDGDRPRRDFKRDDGDRKPFRSRDDRPRREGGEGFKRREGGDFKKRDDFKGDRPRREGSDFKRRDFKRDDGDRKPRRDFDRDGGDRKPFRKREDGGGFKGRDFKRDDRDRGEGFKKPYYKKDYDREPREPAKPRLHATLWGVHAVQEAWLNPARKIKTFYATEHALKAFLEVYEKAKELGLKRPMPEVITKEEFDRSFPTAVHQGLALDAESLEETFLQDMINEAATREKTTLLLLDQVTDPHNVGAIMRSASAFGAAGMIMQDRNAPEVTPVLAKSACGAVEHLPVAFETNLGRALAQLREAGFFTIGLDEHSETTFADYKGHAKIVIVLGAEGKGMRPGLREHLDAVVTLPTQGAIRSLNVSNAAAVALYALKVGA